MRRWWLFLADRFDALQPRERVVIFCGVVGVLLAGFYVLVLDPGLMRYQQAQRRIEQNSKLITALDAQELALITAAADASPAQLLKRLAQQREDNDARRDRLASQSRPIITADKMRLVLADLIAGQRDVKLVAMRSRAPVDLLADDAGSAPKADASVASLYRQSLEVTVQGQYRQLADYLHAVENLSWRARIDGVSLKVLDYPQAQLVFNVHTLSLEKPWIGL